MSQHYNPQLKTIRSTFQSFRLSWPVPFESRLWYLKYRLNGKESHLGLGACPDVSLVPHATPESPASACI